MSVKNYSNTVDLEKIGIPKIEREIAAISEKTLPNVTSEDNGKVLKVANGAWGLGNDNSLPDVSAAFNGYILQIVDAKATWVDLNGNNDQF